jgi:alpha-N-arabinofuranosidase
MVAEGGTEYGHMETIARGTTPYGPWESCPHNPILTNRSGADPVVGGAGHADLIQDHVGNWWAVCLAFRFGNQMSAQWHHLGRETFLVPVEWRDGWPVFNPLGKVAGSVTLEMEAPGLLSAHAWPPVPVRDDFAGPRLGLEWNFVRFPQPGEWSLSERPGFLRLRGGARTLAAVEPSVFVGRRQQHIECHAATLLDFVPQSPGEEAGLVVLANNEHHYEIAVTRDDRGRCAMVRKQIGDLVVIAARQPLPEGPVVLQVQADQEVYAFSCMALGADEPMPLATARTRYMASEVAGGFTGVYIGLYATGNGSPCAAPADFDWFDYEAAETSS